MIGVLNVLYLERILSQQFLDRKYHDSIALEPNNKQKIYKSFIYFGSQSENLKRDLNLLIEKYYPSMDFNCILSNSFKIGSLF